MLAYDELLGGQDVAAMVRCGGSIAVNWRPAKEQSRSEVMATVTAVTSTAPVGTVIVVSTERDRDAHGDAERVATGMIVTMLARQHGLETASAAFRWYPV